MNSKKQSEAVVNPIAEPASPPIGERKMEQVRDLLFGGLARDYDRRFMELGERLSSELARIERELDKRSAALESRLDALTERFSAQTRQESSARTAAIDDLDARIGQAMRTQRAELSAGLTQLATDLGQFEMRSRETVGQLQLDLASALQEIRATTGDDREKLHREKLGREDLADLMGELSLRLRGPLELPGID